MDEADLAQINEERERAFAISSVLDRDPGEPVEHDGVRCCAECDEPIPKTRLAVWPQAIRCADCQAVVEARRRCTHGR